MIYFYILIYNIYILIKMNAIVCLKNAFLYFFIKSNFMFSIHIVLFMKQLSEIEVRKGHNKRGKKQVKDIKYVSTYISHLQEIKMGVTS